MAIFNKYSQYYDLLYSDKDYEGEADYIDRLIKRYGRSSRKLLDVGCGTGRHDLWFADKGYNVVGIDKSSEMIRIAKATAAAMRKKPEFHICDASRFSLRRKFDVAVALFHVMSYQITNRSFLSALKNVYIHLKNDGLFIFDFWHGPAVLSQRPRIRVKNISKEGMSVRRTSSPRMDLNNNTVDVDFNITVRNNKLKKVIREMHTMRYFFLPELELMLEHTGFKDAIFMKWMTYEDKLDDKAWSGIAIARK